VTNITPYAWHLWSYAERTGGVTNAGFYTIQPFAKEMASSNVWSEQERPAPPSEDELRIADLIASAVCRLLESRPEQAAALREYHGAYPGAKQDRKERLKDLPVSKHVFYERKRLGETYVEAVVDYASQSA